MVNKAFKFRFYPTLAQRRQLTQEFKACRYVWNWALGIRTRRYEQCRIGMTWIELSRILTAQKREVPLLKEASATTLSNTLWYQDEAFKRFFEGHNRKPKFKKRQVHSCSYQMDKRRGSAIFVDGKRLVLPKIGDCRIVWTQRLASMPQSATVYHDKAGRWFISLNGEYELNVEVKPTDRTVGLDLGLKNFIATSDGEIIKPLKAYKQNLRRLKMVQRRLSAKKKGSSNRVKARKCVARLHARIGDQRQDFSHQRSTRIIKNYAAVTIEDIHVSGMMKNGCLSSAVADAGWGTLRRNLTYKAKWYGRTLTVIGRFQRSTGVCPDCGLVGEKLNLSVRRWQCVGCGKTHDRDIAAARVIDQIGCTVRSTGSYAHGLRTNPDDSRVTGDNMARGEVGKGQWPRHTGRMPKAA